MRAIATLIDALFPPLCVHCRREGDWLCPAARVELATEVVLIDPLPVPGINRVVVRGNYDTPTLALLIQQMKYHYWHGCADILTEVLQPIVKEIPGSAVIAPVPLHPRRHRERGFNQSWLISQAIANITGYPVQELLRRTRYTTPQAQLSAQARSRNIVGAIGRGTVAKWPDSVILVDDVITTGSTVAECASVLRQHGVQECTAVALAKG